MAASARMSRNWSWRMILIVTAFGAFALWCLYDARVGYPRFNQRAAEHNRLLAVGPADEWPAQAAQRGWDARFRDEDRLADGTIAMKTEWDFGTQYVMLAGTVAIAALALLRLLRARRRTMHTDEQGFVTIEGDRVPYADITDIDLSLWQRKSIARVHFRRHGGKARTVIDDWIYHGGQEVLAEIQRHTGIGPTAPAGAQGPRERPEATPAAGRPHDAPPDPNSP
jgi:hypothetical protein